MANSRFSIIIPTYTGKEHIGAVFDSILQQEGVQDNYEIIVVIDGPNPRLRSIVEKNIKKFQDRSVNFQIHQFEQNEGRFAARYKGAQLANTPLLLFADDRNILDKNYFAAILGANEPIVIPNVVHDSTPTPISRLLYLVRKVVYRKWSGDFKSYYIDENNFEKSSKGTTGLWIERKLFLEACESIKKTSENLRTVNEDTKLFKNVIESGNRIYKSNEARVYYQSRVGIKKELTHLYERGPRFVDYYFKKGTRFYYCLVLLVALLFLLPLLTLVFSGLFRIFLIALLLLHLVFTVWLSRKFSDVFVVFLFLPLVLAVFCAGIIRALIMKILRD